MVEQALIRRLEKRQINGYRSVNTTIIQVSIERLYKRGIDDRGNVESTFAIVELTVLLIILKY